MKRALEVKDICEAIWAVEKKYDLLNLNIDGVPVWQFMRMMLYYDLARKTGVFSEAHPLVQDTLGNKIRRYADALIFKNPLLDFTPSDVLVIDHVRKVKIDGDYIDVYTKYLLDDLRDEGVSHTIYEWPEFNKHMAAPASNRKHLDIFHLFFKRYAGFIKVRITEAQQETLRSVEGDLKVSLGVDLELISFVFFQVRNFKAKYQLFKRLLRQKKPKKIYVVVAYGLGPLIKAAREQGIEVIELQHGNFSEYHLGYSFPNGEKELALWPDQFWVWKEFWKGMCRMPFKEAGVKVYSFRHMEKEISKYRNYTKRPKQIAVMSQGALGEKIAAEILKYKDYFSEYQVIYKLHPSEFKTWTSYTDLMTLSKLPNVTIVDNTDTPLYRLLAESAIVIGVFSTVIYEAMEFDCAIYLLKLPGVEYMNKLIELGQAKYLEDCISSFKPDAAVSAELKIRS